MVERSGEAGNIYTIMTDKVAELLFTNPSMVPRFAPLNPRQKETFPRTKNGQGVEEMAQLKNLRGQVDILALDPRLENGQEKNTITINSTGLDLSPATKNSLGMNPPNESQEEKQQDLIVEFGRDGTSTVNVRGPSGESVYRFWKDGEITGYNVDKDSGKWTERTDDCVVPDLSIIVKGVKSSIARDPSST